MRQARCAPSAHGDERIVDWAASVLEVSQLAADQRRRPHRAALVRDHAARRRRTSTGVTQTRSSAGQYNGFASKAARGVERAGFAERRCASRPKRSSWRWLLPCPGGSMDVLLLPSTR